jgi:hypothetical protein
LQQNHQLDDSIEVLDIYGECQNECRSSIIQQYIALHPESLAKADREGYLPLHRLLEHQLSTIDDALMMIKRYPIALRHRNELSYMPLHIECKNQCRSSIICQCIDEYPRSLARVDAQGYLPLHLLLGHTSSSIEDALMMIEKYPAALKHRNIDGDPPLHLECIHHCRPIIVSKCIELYPQGLDDTAMDIISVLLDKIDFHEQASILSIVFAARPLSMYDSDSLITDDISKNPSYRRRILHRLPHHVFTPIHESDYRDLNWEPRAAMMMLMSQMQIQQQSRERQQWQELLSRVKMNAEAAATEAIFKSWKPLNLKEDDDDDEESLRILFLQFLRSLQSFTEATTQLPNLDDDMEERNAMLTSEEVSSL